MTETLPNGQTLAEYAAENARIDRELTREALDLGPLAGSSRRVLPPVDCFPWCCHADGHPGQVFTDDQCCETTVQEIQSRTLRPIEVGDGTWEQNHITTYGMGWRASSRIPVVWVGIGDTSTGFTLAVDEARRVGEAILAACDQMEKAHR